MKHLENWYQLDIWERNGISDLEELHRVFDWYEWFYIFEDNKWRIRIKILTPDTIFEVIKKELTLEIAYPHQRKRNENSIVKVIKPFSVYEENGRFPDSETVESFTRIMCELTKISKKITPNFFMTLIHCMSINFNVAKGFLNSEIKEIELYTDLIKNRLKILELIDNGEL